LFVLLNNTFLGIGGRAATPHIGVPVEIPDHVVWHVTNLHIYSKVAIFHIGARELLQKEIGKEGSQKREKDRLIDRSIISGQILKTSKY
jgi:hypothetical protein